MILKKEYNTRLGLKFYLGIEPRSQKYFKFWNDWQPADLSIT